MAGSRLPRRLRFGPLRTWTTGIAFLKNDRQTPKRGAPSLLASLSSQRKPAARFRGRAHQPEFREINASARGLAAFPHIVDFGLELRQRKTADDRLLADDPGRRAVEFELLGLSRDFLDRFLGLGAAHVLLQPVHVRADF